MPNTKAKIYPLYKRLPKQKEVWAENISGSQVHHLFNHSAYHRFLYLLEKKGYAKTKPFKGNEYTKHGEKCEWKYAIPFLEDKFDCKNDKARTFINPTARIAGNIDFLNLKKKILCEIKTTSYYKGKTWEEQSDTIKHSIFQMLFYEDYLKWAFDVNLKTFLVVVENNYQCVSKGNCEHDILVFSLADIKNQNPWMIDINVLATIKAFWKQYDNFDKLYAHGSKWEKECEKWIDNFSFLKRQLKTLEHERTSKIKRLMTPELTDILKLEKDIKVCKKEISKIKDQSKYNVFYYSEKQHTVWFNYQISVKNREMKGIKIIE